MGSPKLSFENLERRDMLSAGPARVSNVEVSSSEWSTAFTGFLQSAGLGTNGYSIPVGSFSQSSTLPWTNINRISITFNEDVDVNCADLSLSGVNTVASAFTDFRYNPLTHVATWSLGSPLTKDRFQLDLDGDAMNPVRDLQGEILDGEWSDNASTYASGDGEAGGDFEFTINVLPGDIDNSGIVAYYDQYYVNWLNGKSTTSAGYLATHDLDGSGSINSIDTQAVTNRMAQQLPAGTPAGTNNDAPSTSVLNRVQISNAAIDHAISLWSAFGDGENGNTGLTYTIRSNSASGLFDDVHINASTGQLILNSAATVSGRARIVIRATDSGGLFTENTATIDVNRANQAPVISNVWFSNVGSGTWIIQGSVTDADDDERYFTINAWGIASARTWVDDNGDFEFAIYVPEEESGWEFLSTLDPHGLESNIVSGMVGLI
jgi:hypothetical protein